MSEHASLDEGQQAGETGDAGNAPSAQMANLPEEVRLLVAAAGALEARILSGDAQVTRLKFEQGQVLGRIEARLRRGAWGEFCRRRPFGLADRTIRERKLAAERLLQEREQEAVLALSYHEALVRLKIRKPSPLEKLTDPYQKMVAQDIRTKANAAKMAQEALDEAKVLNGDPAPSAEDVALVDALTLPTSAEPSPAAERGTIITVPLPLNGYDGDLLNGWSMLKVIWKIRELSAADAPFSLAFQPPLRPRAGRTPLPEPPASTATQARSRLRVLLEAALDQVLSQPNPPIDAEEMERQARRILGGRGFPPEMVVEGIKDGLATEDEGESTKEAPDEEEPQAEMDDATRVAGDAAEPAGLGTEEAAVRALMRLRSCTRPKARRAIKAAVASQPGGAAFTWESILLLANGAMREAGQ
ncbi:MAG: hypothetical protein M5U26_19710 [Planctomycetota bacterium]|nr:hypothetical protein [Planctomycetota bacterium]